MNQNVNNNKKRPSLLFPLSTISTALGSKENKLAF